MPILNKESAVDHNRTNAAKDLNRSKASASLSISHSAKWVKRQLRRLSHVTDLK